MNANLLVPFPATVATRVKKIASMNGLPATLVARLLIMRALDSLDKSAPLTLRVVEEVK